jgi:Tol biopolymer transport system component
VSHADRVAHAVCPLVAAAALYACVATDSPSRIETDDAAAAHVVFYSYRDGNAEIYRMRLGEDEPVRLTFHSAADVDPDLSPDGTQVVFTSNRSGSDDVYVLGVAGGEPINLTNSPARDGWARWSPDGRRIAFHSDRDGDPEIYVMNADGTGVTRLTSNPGPDLWPDWSPDGRRIAFRRGMDVWVMDADGTNASQLTSLPTLDQMAVWSPDGESLAFMSLREGYCAVYIMRADGADQRNLTPKDAADANEDWCSRTPAWLPDGRVLFMSKRPATAGDEELFAVRADGSELTRLTHAPGADGAPRAR